MDSIKATDLHEDLSHKFTIMRIYVILTQPDNHHDGKRSIRSYVPFGYNKYRLRTEIGQFDTDIISLNHGNIFSFTRFYSFDTGYGFLFQGNEKKFDEISAAIKMYSNIDFTQDMLDEYHTSVYNRPKKVRDQRRYTIGPRRYVINESYEI